MSLLARMVVLRSGKIGTLDESRYQSINVTSEAEEGNTTITEVWSSTGIMGVPPNESMGLRLELGGNTDLIIATKPKLEPPSLVKGETMFYSTDTGGETLKASIKAMSNGDLEMNGNSKRLVTWQELQTILTTMQNSVIAHTHPETGTTTSPSAELVTLNLDISSAKTTTLKTGG